MKKLILSLAAVAALASCATNENDTPVLGNDDPVEIKVGYASLEATTKAPFEGVISAGKPLIARVIASATQNNYSTLLTTNDHYMTFVTNAVDDAGEPVGFQPTAVYFPTSGVAYLCGLYPQTGWTVGETNATIKFNGTTDVMAAQQVTATKGNNAPVLAFNHLLTKLHISVKAADQGAIGAWTNITKIELTKAEGNTPAGEVSVALTTGLGDFSAATSDAVVTCLKWNGTAYEDNAFTGPVTLTEELQDVAYVLCEPVNPDGTADYQLQVTAGDVVRTVDIDVDDELDVASTAGYYIDVELTFKGTAITAKATVKDWVDGGTATGEVQG